MLTRGLKLTVDNYSYKCGGIDLIMKEGFSQLIFIEVKCRSKNVHGATIETITHFKKARLRLTAAHLLYSHREH
ncbi:MAG: hypothetical protein CMQ16_05545 [Gammaproteobacteria bacterium]|nr:hypothetical protein [Gammaproteobacteria bacterium]